MPNRIYINIKPPEGGFMKKILLSIAALLCVQSVSQAAIFEAKVSYTLLSSKPDLGDTLPEGVPSYGLGFDLLVMPPLIPVGVGLRQENLGFSVDNSTAEAKLTATRTSVVINSRLLDTLFYVGPVFTYGLSHTGKMEGKVGVTKFSEKPDSFSSYSLGLEAGVRLGVLIGAEAGYMSFKTKGGNDTDLSGSYAKVFLGFGF